MGRRGKSQRTRKKKRPPTQKKMTGSQASKPQNKRRGKKIPDEESKAATFSLTFEGTSKREKENYKGCYRPEAGSPSNIQRKAEGEKGAKTRKGPRPGKNASKGHSFGE